VNGGGENNNSVAATNGNMLGRLNHANAIDPSALHNHRTNMSPGLRNNISPHLRNNLSPGMRSNLSPAVRNNLSPGMRTNMSPAMRTGSMPNSMSGGVRSARQSPSLSRSTPRVSPATVTLSSGESSPAGSRPTSPQHPFVPINPPPVNSLPNSRSPSPDIEIVEEIVKAVPATPTPVSTKKRMRGSDENDVGNGLESKRARYDYVGAAKNVDSPVITQNGLDRSHRDGREPGSDNNAATTPLSVKKVSRNDSDMLNAQIFQARTGKVKTTKELIKNLGIDSGAVNLPVSGPVKSVSSLVPDENKKQLMDRFFASQSQVRESGSRKTPAPGANLEEDEITEIREDEEEDDVIEVLSRPGTGFASTLELKSQSNSQLSSRINTPAPTTTTVPQTKQSVDDIMRLLEPVDTAAVLAEWEERLREEEIEEDIPGLIPVYKPKLEITESVVDDLNNGELDYIGGVKDYTGSFKEWHEMVALERCAGTDQSKEDPELLHILPYSVID